MLLKKYAGTPSEIPAYFCVFLFISVVIYEQKCQKSDQSDDLHRKSGYRNMFLSDNDQGEENNKCNTHDNISYGTTIHYQSLLSFQSAESHTLCQTFLYHDI